MNNEIKINVPEGMEIDRENSTFECIKFKLKWVPKRGDFATAGDQIILVGEYIKKNNIVGFNVKGLAVLYWPSNILTLGKDLYGDNFWVLEEASASERKLFIEKLNKQGYVYDPNDPRVIYKKEKELPKTWEEFCDNDKVRNEEVFINGCSEITEAELDHRNPIVDANLLPSKEYAEAMLALCKLIQLRDCYNDGWKPNWNNSETKYNIYTRCNKLEVGTVGNVSFVLTFKTQKLRDTFLYNFKDLIEQAKLLL